MLGAYRRAWCIRWYSSAPMGSSSGAAKRARGATSILLLAATPSTATSATITLKHDEL